MKRKTFLCFIATLLIATGTAFGQKAGQIIRGSVYDQEGPMMMVNVIEIDAANRLVAACVTDFNGNFSFKLVNPKDRIKVSFVGYKAQILPINNTVFKIRMTDATQIKELVVKSKRRTEGSGLSVPVTEISTARQTIDAKEFDGLPVTTIDEALQGRIAGLDIIANSGNLGSGTSMRLRGVSSINGSSEPLIVVDGNVWETDASSNFDYNSANDEKFAELLNINPEDIASISVLKDAAATAIWGSQGSNGVIEIKTKRGATGKTKVSYSYRVTGTYQPNGMKMLNGDQYTMLMKEEYFNPKLSDDASNIVELNYDPTNSEYEMYNNNTDWIDAVKQTGWQQKHNFAISGGGEKANFRIAAGYDHETGSIIKQSLDRFTTRVALDYFVSDRIKITTNIAMTYTDNQKNYSDLLSLAYVRMPNLSIYEQDANGNNTANYYNMLSTGSSELSDQRTDSSGNTIANPVALANMAKDNESSFNIEPEFQLKYNLLGINDNTTKLTYEGKIVFNIFNKYDDTFYPADLVTSGWSSTSANKSTSEAYKSLGVTTTHTLTFIPKFKNEDHSLSMMLRGQMTSGNSNTQYTSEYGIPSGTIQSTAANAIINGFSTSAGQWRSVYFTFSTHYAYKGKYMLDFTVRS